MNNIQIGIIGGTRGMGAWFARFLEAEGHTVHVSGRSRGMNVAEMTGTCQVIVISVPIGATAAVIAEVGPCMRKDQLLMDLTSLKQEPVRVMLETSVSEVIGCHPLFGPHIDSLSGRRVVICPAGTTRWHSWLKDVFKKNGAIVLETTPEKHDRMMAIVQGLNHINTIVMGLVMSNAGVSFSELRRFATPAFQAKLEIIEKVFCHNPALYADIISMNPHSRQLIEDYEKQVTELKNLVYEGKAADITDMIGKQASFFEDACE